MGGNSDFFCSRQFSSPHHRLPKQDSNDDRGTSFTTLIFKFLKSSCLWREKKTVKKKLSEPPKSRQKKKKKQQKVKMVKELTIEEWFSTSSPCRKDYNSLHIKTSSTEHNTWIFPSPDDDEDVMSNSRHSFYQQRVLIEVIDCGRRRSDVSGLSSRKGGKKVKKRVSFKLPEESDILIFCSRKADSEE